jgi:hypothetical protein
LLDEADRAMRSGSHAEAVEIVERALSTRLEPHERVEILTGLSAAYWHEHRVEDSVRVARDACELAAEGTDELAEARAAISLGNALVAAIEERYEESKFAEALAVLDRSATILERLEHIDLAAALLTMAEAWLLVDERHVATSLFTRVTRDLEDSRWASPEEVARQADLLRGRAFRGLGLVALREGDRANAHDHLAAAAELIVAAHPHDPLLDELIDMLDSEFDDRTLADEIRTKRRQWS